MNEELVDRLAKFHWSLMASSQYNAPWENMPEGTLIKTAQRELVRGMLMEIEAAGYELVPADRMKRLRKAAFHWFEWHKDFGDSDKMALVSAGLEAGDLDRDVVGDGSGEALPPMDASCYAPGAVDLPYTTDDDGDSAWGAMP